MAHWDCSLLLETVFIVLGKAGGWGGHSGKGVKVEEESRSPQEHGPQKQLSRITEDHRAASMEAAWV